mmetsp:Transcript_1269/g.1339  ORF Transcript_1269/g.1339 Transcript_1269/m.1339 type:complete len:129 (+) Transcript_1269:1320-1706(+)
MMTPLYESTPRNVDTMPNSIFGGMSCFDQPNQMRNMPDFSVGQYPSFRKSSPLMQSPSPNFRLANRFNPDTPQTPFHARTNTWQREGGMGLYYQSSPLLSFNGRPDQLQQMNPMDNPNSIFTKRNQNE